MLAIRLLILFIATPAFSGELRPQTVLDPVDRILINCRSVHCPTAVPTIQKNSPDVRIDLYVSGVAEFKARYPKFDLTRVRLHENIQEGVSAPYFLRDIGLFLLGGQERAFVELPYANLSLGTTWSGYFRFNDAPPVPRMINSFLLPADLDRILAEKDLNLRFVSYHNAAVSFLKDKRAISPSMGGDYLALPDGPVLVGETGWSALSPGLETFLSTYFKIERITLPDTLSVGHLDEVYATVPLAKPSPGECGYALLYQVEDPFLEFGRAHPDAYLYDPEELTRKAGESALIRQQAQKIRALAADHCRLRLLEITGQPLRRSQGGYPFANGVSVGDVYYYSAPPRSGEDNPVGALALAAERKLRDALSDIGIRAVPIHTESALSSGGGFHCATQELRRSR